MGPSAGTRRHSRSGNSRIVISFPTSPEEKRRSRDLHCEQATCGINNFILSEYRSPRIVGTIMSANKFAAPRENGNQESGWDLFFYFRVIFHTLFPSSLLDVERAFGSLFFNEARLNLPRSSRKCVVHTHTHMSRTCKKRDIFLQLVNRAHAVFPNETRCSLVGGYVFF